MAVPPPSASEPIDPGLIARFAADLAAAAGGPVGGGERLALAVSGGPDSMAMLVLAHAALPGRIVAATVDHGLRPGSAAEAALVSGWCAAAGVDHAVLRLDAPLPGAGLQAAARAARYRVLGRWAVTAGARILATAHHADDQAETFLMRANRGSGLQGLAAIRPCRLDRVSLGTAEAPLVSDLAIVRPLLGWRRADLRRLVEQAGVPFALDPSNADARFDRVRMRGFLAGQDVLDPAALARAAAHLAEAEADLRAVADWAWRDRRRVSGAGDVLFDTAGLPRALRRSLARTAIGEVRATRDIARPHFSDATNVESLLDALETGGSGTQGGVMASAQALVWRFREAPPRRSL